MKAYNEIVKKIFGKDHVTYQVIVHILSEEAGYEETIEDLLEDMPCAFSR